MNLGALFADANVTVGLIGAGQFGAALIGQIRRVPGLRLAVVCDLDIDRAVALCTQAGFDPVRIIENAGDLRRVQAIANGIAIVADTDLVTTAGIDIVIEATGDAEIAATTAVAALRARKHVAMVTKEAESVVGSELHAMATAASCIYTPVDGDQPSLLIGMVSWAQSLGLDICCAGKSSEYDFVYDPIEGTVSWRDTHIRVPDFAGLWHLAADSVRQSVAARSAALAALPQRTVPDLTEMAIVANATGIQPDTPEFHLPLARTVEVPDVFRPATAGGLLQRHGVIDVFNCLRRPDEASFAGGVFVVVRCEDARTWEILADKGHPVSQDGGYAMLYNPQHLLGLEAPTTLLSVGVLGKPTGNATSQPVCDVVARAYRDFSAGERLEITDAHHHEVDGLTPEVQPGRPLQPDAPLPYYLATGQTLTENLQAGEMVCARHIVLDSESTLVQLRRAQDARFFPEQ